MIEQIFKDYKIVPGAFELKFITIYVSLAFELNLDFHKSKEMYLLLVRRENGGSYLNIITKHYVITEERLKGAEALLNILKW